MQQAIRAAKNMVRVHETAKAKRRAAHHGKGYGKLVWRLLRRAQNHPECTLSLLPKDVLRLVVKSVAEDESARLEQLYTARVAAGAASWRGDA